MSNVNQKKGNKKSKSEFIKNHVTPQTDRLDAIKSAIADFRAKQAAQRELAGE